MLQIKIRKAFFCKQFELHCITYNFFIKQAFCDKFCLTMLKGMLLITIYYNFLPR